MTSPEFTAETPGETPSSQDKHPVPTTVLENETCPFCHAKSLTLTEGEMEVPYFGKLFIFSMACKSCKYHKSDVEAAERFPPVKWTFEVSGEDDLRVRVVKSAEATVRVPRIASIEPGPASSGYVTTIEGIILRIKEQVETMHDSEEDEEKKEKCQQMLKKIQRVLLGQEQLVMHIEDPSGNSAILSEKAVKSHL